MLEANYVIRLNTDSLVETIGGNVEATRVCGHQYEETVGLFDDENHTPIIRIHGQTGWFRARQSDVTQIIDIAEIEE